ncbi:MAG: hypothetical protein ABIS86_06865 [Streptosporangiaceae bacterium]
MRQTLAVAVAALSLTVAALSVAVVPAVAAAAVVTATTPSPYGMAISGAANHANPLPGQKQVHSFTVTNTGTEPLRAAWISVKVTDRWTVRVPDGCRPEGERTLCELGTLSPRESQRVAFRMTVPRKPDFGPVQVKARTGAKIPGARFAGPTLVLQMTVVKNRVPQWRKESMKAKLNPIRFSFPGARRIQCPISA